MLTRISFACMFVFYCPDHNMVLPHGSTDSPSKFTRYHKPSSKFLFYHYPKPLTIFISDASKRCEAANTKYRSFSLSLLKSSEHILSFWIRLCRLILRERILTSRGQQPILKQELSILFGRELLKAKSVILFRGTTIAFIRIRNNMFFPYW